MRVIVSGDRVSGTECPRCRHRPTVPFEKAGRTGSFCPKCAWISWDLASVRHEFTCRCGRAMGPIYTLSTAKLGKYICFACAARRRSSGLAPNPRVKVRYEAWCAGRCGSLQGWVDLPEAVPLNDQTGHYMCTPCATAGRNQAIFGKAPKIVIPVLVESF